MTTRHITMIILATALAACDKKNDAPPPPSAPAKLVGMPLDAKDQNATVKRRLAIQGQWQGQPDKSARHQFIVMDLAGTSEYTIDLKGMEGGREAIYASGRGKLSWGGDDVLAGRGTADDAIGHYASWRAGFPAQGVMTVRTSKGDVELRRTP